MSEVVVWIADGCITCDACEEEYPEVFKVTDDTCYITADSRTDGGFDTNEGTKSSLKSGLDLEAIQDAAGGCPVDVIMVEVGGGGDSTPEAAEDSADEVVEPVETAPVAVEASMDGDRSLLVLSGSQSGNSEAIAAKIGKLADNYSLEATVKGMDEIQIGDLAGISEYSSFAVLGERVKCPITPKICGMRLMRMALRHSQEATFLCAL